MPASDQPPRQARPSADPEPPGFRDAEAWLAARGVEREPLEVTPADETADAPHQPATHPRGVASLGEPQISIRDAGRLAEQSASDARMREADAHALPDPAHRGLEDDVARAVAFVRRSTAVAPQSEGRLRTKLTERGFSDRVIQPAMERARIERLVDDAAMAAAFVEERRAKGHALARIRRDLRQRGFDEHTLDEALADAEREDPEAAAFELAMRRAAGLTAVPAETAFTRIVRYLARRGHPEGLARKVAREAVFTARDAARTSGR